MGKIKNLSLTSSYFGIITLSFGALILFLILRKGFNMFKASQARLRFQRIKEAKLNQMKQGYEEVKRLHPRQYPPQLVKKVARATISELQELLWDKNSGISSVDLVAIFSQRAYIHGTKYGWLAEQMFVQAYEKAKKRDYERKLAKMEGRRLSKIHGIPFSIKDHINKKGAASHWGHFSQLFNKAKETNLAIQCLVNDGAIPFVKSAAPFIPTLICDNPFSGDAKNPYNLERSTGGSSGGQGGLVGSGCSPFGIGSDQAGSLRVPSSHCKLTTISMSCERIGMAGSNQGLITKELKIPDLPLPTTLGPMCKNVEDCISVVESWCSPERLSFFPQAMQVPLTGQEVLKHSGKKLRIGYLVDDGYIRTCPAVKRTVLQAKKLLEDNGHTLIEYKLPPLHTYRKAMDSQILKDQLRGVWKGLQPHEPLTKVAEKIVPLIGMSRPMIRLIQFLLRKERDNVTPNLTGKEIIQNQMVLYQWKQKAEEVFSSLNVDAFLSPVLECVAPCSKTFQLGPPSSLPGIINFLGMTGSSVPFGRVTEEDLQEEYEDYHNDKLGRGMKEVIKGSVGMPIGVQISSFPGREAIVFSLMKEIEERTVELNNYFPDF